MGYLYPNADDLLSRIDRHVDRNYMCYALALWIEDASETSLVFETVQTLGLQYYRPTVDGQLVDQIIWVVIDFRYANVKYNFETVKDLLAAIQSDSGVQLARLDQVGDNLYFRHVLNHTYQGFWINQAQFLPDVFFGYRNGQSSSIDAAVDFKSLNYQFNRFIFDGKLDLQYLLGHDLKTAAFDWGSMDVALFAGGATLFSYLPPYVLTNRLYNYVMYRIDLGMVMVTVSGFAQLAPFLDALTPRLLNNSRRE